MLEAATATWPEVEQRIAQGAIAVMAFGAQEQHGPHLPLATDTVMASALARRLAEHLDAILLPAIPLGDAWNNSGFPGTLSLSFNTVHAIVLDVCKSLASSGVQALILVNGHFGNRSPIELAVREARTELQFPVLALDYPGLERLALAICDSQPAAPSFYHAEEVETSIMLALMPDAVRMDKAQAEYPQFPPTYGAEAIRLDTFCQTGVFGDPTAATADKGKRLLDGLTAESLARVTAFVNRLKGTTVQDKIQADNDSESAL